MGVYIVTLIVFFIFSLIEVSVDKNSRILRTFKIISFVLITIQIGLRWETGTDWTSYFENFNNTDNLETVIFNTLTGYEIGYGVFVLLLKSVYNSYSFFLLIHALLFYFILFSVIKKYSALFFPTLMLFYALNLGMVGSNRQLMALVICLYSLVFVEKRNLLFFILLIFIASLFHMSALLFSVFYFLNRDFSSKFVFVVLICAIVLGFTELPQLMFSKLATSLSSVAEAKSSFYANSEASSLSQLGLAKRLFLFLLFSYNYNNLSSRLHYYKLLYNGYLVGFIFYFLFSGSLLILVSRGSLYFNVMESFLFSSQLFLFTKLTDRILLSFFVFAMSIVFLFQSVSIYPDLFSPYKSVFYNTEYRRNLY